MDFSDPYSPPTSATPPLNESPASIRFRSAGIAVGATIGSLYVVIFGASIYEYGLSTPPQSTTDYVRTAIMSAVFAILSFTAVTCYLKRMRIGHWLLCLSPMLLVVFVFPGLNTVWNTVERLFRF